MSVFTAYLYFSLGDVSSLQEKTYYSLVFLVNNSSDVFLLSVSGSASFFPAVQTICRFGNFIKFN